MRSASAENSKAITCLSESSKFPPRISPMATHALFETASGYAIFKVNFKEEIGSKSSAVQDSIDDLAKFGKMVSLVSFSPFKSAAHALENANDVSEGQSHLS